MIFVACVNSTRVVCSDSSRMPHRARVFKSVNYLHTHYEWAARTSLSVILTLSVLARVQMWFNLTINLSAKRVMCWRCWPDIILYIQTSVCATHLIEIELVDFAIHRRCHILGGGCNWNFCMILDDWASLINLHQWRNMCHKSGVKGAREKKESSKIYYELTWKNLSSWAMTVMESLSHSKERSFLLTVRTIVVVAVGCMTLAFIVGDKLSLAVIVGDGYGCVAFRFICISFILRAPGRLYARALNAITMSPRWISACEIPFASLRGDFLWRSPELSSSVLLALPWGWFSGDYVDAVRAMIEWLAMNLNLMLTIV